MDKQYYIYIITNHEETVLYTGFTNDLIRRTYEHKNKLLEGFSSKYNLNKLVYYEVFDNPEDAIKREKQVKKWPRKWKLDTINKFNPDWVDLYESIL